VCGGLGRIFISISTSKRERRAGRRKRGRKEKEEKVGERGTANRLLGITLLTVSVSLGGEADDVMAFTWNTGTQSHERNGGDRVFETDSAAQMRGQVTDDGRQDANHQNRNKETDVAVRNVCKQMVDLFLETKEASSAIIMSTPQFSTK
jgi:hypothetical protein